MASGSIIISKPKSILEKYLCVLGALACILASSDFGGLFWVMNNRLCKIEYGLAVFADRELTLGHELISRGKFDIGEVSLRPCDYFSVVGISKTLLCEPQSAV